jgi:hypothetical protein
VYDIGPPYILASLYLGLNTITYRRHSLGTMSIEMSTGVGHLESLSRYRDVGVASVIDVPWVTCRAFRPLFLTWSSL